MTYEILPLRLDPPTTSVIRGLVVTLAVLAVLGGYGYYRHLERVRENREAAARRARIEQRISQFAQPHNAVMDWQDPLGTNQRKVYSAELTPLVVREDGRPIFLFASVDDVSNLQGEVLIYFDGTLTLHAPLKLRLECTAEQGRLVMSSSGWDKYFAVVAQIQSVESTGRVMRDTDAEGDKLEFVPLAAGRCIDVMPLSIIDWLHFTMK